MSYSPHWFENVAADITNGDVAGLDLPARSTTSPAPLPADTREWSPTVEMGRRSSIT